MSTRYLTTGLVCAVLLTSARPAQAQFFGFGYPFYGMGGGTVLGNAMAGTGIYMAGAGRFMAGAGQFNTLSGQGAISYQQAYSMGLANRLNYAETYFQLRRQNASDRAAMAAMRPHYTPEQYAADNRARTPARLSSVDWDPAQGIYVWPQNLADDEFAGDRAEIELLFAERDADPNEAGLGTANYREIRLAVTDMHDHLHALIDQMSPDEYIPCYKFLKSVEREARFVPGM